MFDINDQRKQMYYLSVSVKAFYCYYYEHFYALPGATYPDGDTTNKIQNIENIWNNIFVGIFYLTSNIYVSTAACLRVKLRCFHSIFVERYLLMPTFY